MRTLNVVPKDVLDNISPHEALHGAAPDLSTFRVFGWRAFVPVAHAARHKLQPRMRSCILLASGSGNMYRVFDTSTQHLHVARHVRCDETVIPGYGTPPALHDQLAPDVLQPSAPAIIDDTDVESDVRTEDVAGTSDLEQPDEPPQITEKEL